MRPGELRLPAGTHGTRIRRLAKPHDLAERSERGPAGAALKKRPGGATAKRIIDGDAVWGSSKLANCKEEFIPEYTWLYALADANGNFEIGDLRVIHGKVAAIRPHFGIDTLRQVLDDFHRHGLLYIWEEHGKKYGHWTGSNKPGRLPPKSQRNHYPKLDVTTPSDKAIEKYWNGLKADPETLRLFPAPAALQAEAAAIGKEYAGRAEGNGDESQKFKQAKWELFWELYPNKQDEQSAKTIFLYLPVAVLDDVIAAVLVYKASPQWQQGFIQKARKWLQEENWKKSPPKENTNARRIIGPAGRTTEEYRNRAQKAAKTLRLDHP